MASNNLIATEVKQRRERLNPVSGEFLGDERIDVTQLCDVLFVPPLRHTAIYRNGIHQKDAVS